MSKGDDIRRLRMEAGFTLDELSGAMGVSIALLSLIERGERSVSLEQYTSALNGIEGLRGDREARLEALKCEMGFGRRGCGNGLNAETQSTQSTDAENGEACETAEVEAVGR